MKRICEPSLLRSITQTNSINPYLESIQDWIGRIRSEASINIERIPLDSLNDWCLDQNEGVIKHKTGRFFSITGISVKTNFGRVKDWSQPIIDQPEVGFLGFIASDIEGVTHLLVQAKIEPGNINYVQLSPTLQATKSNYTGAHQGRKPDYLEYFVNRHNCQVISDQLQSEQNARFFKKRNRNIIVHVKDYRSIEVKPGFRWMTIGEIKMQMRHPNLVNMDTRTVLASGSLFNNGSIREMASSFLRIEPSSKLPSWHDLSSDAALHPLSSILAWIAGLKAEYELQTKKTNLFKISDWLLSDGALKRRDNKYFEIIGVNVEISAREVSRWDQPMISPSQHGIIAFLIKRINGVYHFLVQAKSEPGCFDLLELAPTVQCLTGSYEQNALEYVVPYLAEVQSSNSERVIYDVYQSEEGGRFFQEQNRNMLVIADDSLQLDASGRYMWVSLWQVMHLLQFSNIFNIGARSLISAVMIHE